MNADREKIFRVVLGDSGFFFHGVSHVIDSVVELWRVVVDVARRPEVTSRDGDSPMTSPSGVPRGCR